MIVSPITSPRSLVVLIHGFLGTRIQLLPIATYLSQQHDVLNFTYRSRAQTLQVHSETLVDVVSSRLQKTNQRVHFVTHSFGGVVLHRAFSQGLQELVKDDLPNTRCVLVAPPLRGASFARAFQKQNIVGPEVFRSMIHSTAKTILGDKSGYELMINDEKWFREEVGAIPDEVKLLIVSGSCGQLNPLIDGDSDGVVSVQETIPSRHYYHVKVPMTHNLLLYNPTVVSSISQFLSGEEIGEFCKSGTHFSYKS